MDKALNLSGARLKKKGGFGERIHEFRVDDRPIRVKNNYNTKKT